MIEQITQYLAVCDTCQYTADYHWDSPEDALGYALRLGWNVSNGVILTCEECDAEKPLFPNGF